MTHSKHGGWEQQTDLFHSDCARFLLATTEINEVMKTELYLTPLIFENETLGLYGFFRGLGSEKPAVVLISTRDLDNIIVDPSLINDTNTFKEITRISHEYCFSIEYGCNKEDENMRDLVESNLKERWTTT